MRVSKVLLIMLVTLSIFCFSNIAYAEDVGSGGGDFSDKVIYGPSVFNVAAQQYGIQTYSSNEFNAALTALGYDPYDSRFDADVKAYLSNESTGVSFYEFASGFTNNNNVDWGSNIYSVSFASALGTNNNVYGSSYVWMRIYTQDLFDAAKQRVVDVLAGNVGGSGDGGYETDINAATYYLRFQPDIRDNVHYYKMRDGTRLYTTNVPNVMMLTFNSSTNNNIKYRFSQGYDMYINVASYTGNNDGGYFNVYMMHDTDYEYLSGTNNDGTTFNYVRVKPNTTYYTMSDRGDTCTLSDGVLNQNVSATKTLRSVTTSGNVYLGASISTGDIVTQTFGMYQLIVHSDGTVTGGPDDPVPPTNWPDPEPTNPTEPPTVPEPPEPTNPTEPPTVTAPTAPTLPTPTYPTEPTYNNPDLSSILDAMQRHCVHLQECMHNCFEDYYDNITAYQKSLQEDSKEFFRSWFRLILDTIRDCFDDLSEYLEDLFHWLADQMDFNFSGNEYDDSSLLYWLKRIYSKLGGGTSVKPVDPVVDPTGTGDWLDELFKNLVNALLGLGQNALADVADMIRQLINKFPFSIPWDIAAILTLLAAEPQTPVITIPQYALVSTGVSKVGDYVIDLQPYDGVMEAARNMEKLLFAFWLCWKIDFFKSILNGIGIGGNE